LADREASRRAPRLTFVLGGLSAATRWLNFKGYVNRWSSRDRSIQLGSANSRTKKPGAVSRPGTLREFQFPE
jgi:hypothetical protein